MIKGSDIFEGNLKAPLEDLKVSLGEAITSLKDIKKVAGDAEKSLSMETTLTKSASSMQKVVDSSKQLETVEKTLVKSIEDRTKAEIKLQKEINDSAKVTKGYKEVIAGLKNELKAAEAEMILAGEQSGKMSDEFQAAAKKAGEIRDRIADMKDESKAFAGGNAIENMTTRFGLLGNELKNLNFEGVSEQVKGITALSKGMTFKEAINGVGGLGKSFAQLGKVILTNPLFLIVAVIVGIIVAVVKLKDSIPFLSKVFDTLGAAVDWVIQQLKDFSDWLGITSFAADEKRAKIVENAKKEQEALEKRYDREIKLAQTAGENTLELERKKQIAILLTSNKAIQALREQYQQNGKFTEDQQAQWDELLNKASEAMFELEVLKVRQQKEEKKRHEERMKQIDDQIKKEIEADAKRAELELKKQAAHIKEMEELAVRIAYRLTKEEEMYDLLDGLEQEHVEKFMSYKELMDERAVKSREKQIEEFQKQQQDTAYIVDGLSKLMSDTLTTNENFTKTLMKRLFIFVLDALEKEMLAVQAAAIAKMTAQSLAQADSVATFGATGITRALVLSGLIKAGFAVAKAQIAKFADGTENAPGGLAYVGERGRELIMTPDRNVFLSPDKATLTYLPQGSVVKTNTETEKALKNSSDYEDLANSFGRIWEQGSQVFRILKNKDGNRKIIRLKYLSE